MDNNILNSLLKEYDKKRIKSELDLERRKQNLYKLIPELEKIESEINICAISSAKNILNNLSNENSTNKLSILKERKKQLLEKNHISENYLKPNYECRICNDTGYFLDKSYRSQMCNCLKQQILDISYNKSNMSNLKKENFMTFNENIFSDEVDFAKYKVNISNEFPMNSTDISIVFGNALDNAIEACERLDSEKKEINLVISNLNMNTCFVKIINSYDNHHSVINKTSKKEYEKYYAKVFRICK